MKSLVKNVAVIVKGGGEELEAINNNETIAC
jgi:hypothetical protein